MNAPSPRSFGFAVLRLLAALMFVGIVASPPRAQSASWNDGIGMGAANEDQFAGSGALLSVVTSVHSNALYYISSGNNAGSACFERILVKPDLTGCSLDFYTATNAWLCASNQMAGTNIIWLSSTNAGLATNDLLAWRSALGDVTQLTILSGNATDAAGLVFTNDLGQCAIKLFNPLTNAVAPGDCFHKLARVARFNPLSDHAVTNKVLSPWGNWLNYNDVVGGQALNLQGKISNPTAVVLTFSNAAGLFVSGKYHVRTRR